MEKQNAKELEFAAFVGWDWADQQHELRLQEAGSAKIERQVIKQNPVALIEWVEQLRQRFGDAKVAIAIEQSRGPVVYALMVYEFLVIYPINPFCLARYREAFRPSKAKDDPFDARLILDMLVKHRDQLKPWRPDDELTRTLRWHVECRRAMVADLTRYTNRMTRLLKSYFPQALGWVGDLNSRLACDFLSIWPTLEAVQDAGQSALREFYKKRGCRRKTIDRRLNEINEAKPLTTDQAVVSSSVMMVKIQIRLVRSLIESLDELDKRIEELFAKHPDRDLFTSFPGAGKVLAPRLTVAFGTDRSRYQSAKEVQRFSGVAPVTERSGRTLFVHRRYACPKFMHQTFVEFAEQSVVWSPWAKAFYLQRRRAGDRHHTTLRALAYRWLRIMTCCWRQGVPYDEEKYQMALFRRGSPLASLLSVAQATSGAD